jgi:hypothetical protein
MRDMRVLAVVVVVGAFASAAYASAGTSSGPSLRLTHARPVVVVGSHFRAGERVSVVAHAARLVVVHTRAVDGSFTARLGVVPLPQCGSTRIVATGSLGSRATMTLRRPPCSPPVSP